MSMAKFFKYLDITAWLTYISLSVGAAIFLILYNLFFTYLNVLFGIIFKLDLTKLNMGVVVTLFVGLSAYILFLKQKNDKKRDAAKIIFLEIQRAVEAINIIKDGQPTIGIQSLPYEIKTLPTENWSKSKYLFINDFKPEQWLDINKFYDLCKLFDEAINFNNSYIEKNYDQYRTHIHNIEAELINKEIEGILKSSTEIKYKDAIKNVQDKIQKYMTIYLATALPYNPQDPALRARKYLETINTNILTSSTGVILREISHI